jgi:DNA-directed RNA polymerase subunit omega
MDPFVVFDGAKVLPNRFALTLAAAARSRALQRGARPRSDEPAASPSGVALHEIAAGAFTPAELALFLVEQKGTHLVPPPALDQKLCGSALAGGAATPVSLPGRRSIDPATNRKGE